MARPRSSVRISFAMHSVRNSQLPDASAAGMTVFCEPFTTAKIRYFDQADAVLARHWLDESIPKAVKPAARSQSQ